MTDQMENLSRSLSFNKVAENWEKVAYPSRKSLATWFNDLIDRNITLPILLRILMNPESNWKRLVIKK